MGGFRTFVANTYGLSGLMEINSHSRDSGNNSPILGHMPASRTPALRIWQDSATFQPDRLNLRHTLPGSPPPPSMAASSRPPTFLSESSTRRQSAGFRASGRDKSPDNLKPIFQCQGISQSSGPPVAREALSRGFLVVNSLDASTAQLSSLTR